MKKFLLASMAVACVLAGSDVASAKITKASASVAPKTITIPNQNPDLLLEYSLSSLYDDGLQYAEYYLIMSSDASAKYDSNTGTITAPTGTYILITDLFNNASDPVVVPEGVYTPINTMEQDATPFVYDDEYSMLNYYDNGEQISYMLTNPIYVSLDDSGIYTISTDITADGETINVQFKGRIPFGNSTEKPTTYPQLYQDVNVNLNQGGISFYQGVTDYSNNGVSIIDLYNVPFDENGVMAQDGWELSMMVSHKRFVKASSYEVIPGEYTNATNFERFTWYPCREIDYSLGDFSITMPFGSYIRRLQTIDGERQYTYAYLKTGTFTIVDNGDGTFSGTVDAITTLGYHVTATWSGSLALNTENATFKSSTSNLEDDVDLDFSTLEVGRIWHQGIKGGPRCYILDLGSPAGRDLGILHGGDLLRIEFLTPPEHAAVQSGVYTVVARRWNDYDLAAGATYEPYSLNQGYFADGGDLSGTRYCHFAEGRYGVYDIMAPIAEGSVRVSTTDYTNYQIEINLVDDAGFEIRGYWDKPFEYMYDRDALSQELGWADINNIASDGARGIQAVVEGSNIVVLNAGNAPVQLYNVYGALMYTGTADMTIPADNLAKGIYIIKVNNTSIKVAL